MSFFSPVVGFKNFTRSRKPASPLRKKPEVQPLNDESADDISPAETVDPPGSELETREFSGVALEGAEDFEMPGEAFGSPEPEAAEDSIQDDGFGEDEPEATQAADFDEMLALSGTLGEPSEY